MVYLCVIVLQSSGLPMPLFNGVGGPYQTSGFGSGTGDNLQNMWSAPVETPNPEDIQESGVSGQPYNYL